MPLRRHAIAAATVCAAVLAACGGPSEEERVRGTLTAFAEATAARDYATLCDDVLAPGLVDDVEAIGLPCERALARGLGDVRAPRLTVGRVRVDGDTANAEVRTSAAGQAPSRDVVELVRTDGGWRIASLAGPSPPSPAP